MSSVGRTERPAHAAEIALKAAAARWGKKPFQNTDGAVRVTLRHPGPHILIAATGGGKMSALEEGVWGRNLAKVSPPLARPQQIARPSSE